MTAHDPLFLDLQQALAGEYSLERELGRGGMGVVYLARDVQLERSVAIKVLPPELALRGELRERFLREARTAARLSHPNIVPIHRVGEAAGLPYFVMTFVDGETLGDRLRARGPMSPSLLTPLLRDVAHALGYAHGRGVIHRDVKPDNILIERESGRALMTDFGIAGRVDDAKNSGDPLMGTAQFMSPEQLHGGGGDGRSDLYALGVVAFLAATGRFPHDAPSTAALMVQRVSVDPPAVATVATQVPVTLARVIDTCLERDPSRRFDDAEALVAALAAPVTPVRTALPAALRSWAHQPAPLLGAYAIWTAGCVELAANAVRINNRHNSPLPFLAMAIVPAVPIVLFQLRKTRRALADGFTIADLRLALRTWRSERLNELAHEDTGGLGDRLEAALRGLVYVSFGLVGIATAAFLAQQFFHPHVGRIIGNQAAFELITLLRRLWTGGMVLGLASGGISGALGVPLLPVRVRRAIAGRLRGWVWNGRVGEWLSRALTPGTRALPATDFRPTEMALAVAIDDLFAALPTTYRDELSDLPAVAARLSARAVTLRDSVAHVEQLAHVGAAGHAGLSPLTPRLADAKRELGETVAALERLRVDLLRLHGGVSDLRPLTTSLDAARRISSDIGRLDGAQRELADHRSPIAIDVRAPSPA